MYRRGSGWWASTSERAQGVSCANADRPLYHPNCHQKPTHPPHHPWRVYILPLPSPFFVELWNDTSPSRRQQQGPLWTRKRFKLNVSSGGRAQSNSGSGSFRVLLLLPPAPPTSLQVDRHLASLNRQQSRFHSSSRNRQVSGVLELTRKLTPLSSHALHGNHRQPPPGSNSNFGAAFSQFPAACGAGRF
jgi:hypothetical protein